MAYVIKQIEIATGTLKYGIDSFLRQVSFDLNNEPFGAVASCFFFSSTKIIYNKPFNIDSVLQFIGLIEKQNQTYFRDFVWKKTNSFIRHACYKYK